MVKITNQPELIGQHNDVSIFKQDIWPNHNYEAVDSVLQLAVQLPDLQSIFNDVQVVSGTCDFVNTKERYLQPSHSGLQVILK